MQKKISLILSLVLHFAVLALRLDLDGTVLGAWKHSLAVRFFSITFSAVLL